MNEIIALQACQNGKYVRAGIGPDSHLVSDSPHILAWETFRLERLGEDKVALRSEHSGNYVRAGVGPNSELVAHSSQVQAWETFKLIQLGHNRVALQSVHSGKYVRGGVGAESHLAASSTHIQVWETFRLIEITKAPVVKDDTSWTHLQGLGSAARPAVSNSGDKIAKLYIAAIAESGYVAYVSSDSPDGWTPWEIIGPEHTAEINAGSPFLANPTTAPCLVSKENEMYLFVRGKDDNLHETHRTETSDWSPWKKVTSDGRVRGKISVVVTQTDPDAAAEFHVMYGTKTSHMLGAVEYRLLNSNMVQVGPTVLNDESKTGTLGTDGKDQLFASTLGVGGGLKLLLNARPWNDAWPDITPTKFASINLLLPFFLDISNTVFFHGDFHFTYTSRRLPKFAEPPDQSQKLVHVRVSAQDPIYTVQTKIMENLLPAELMQATLAVYRNKLVMAYKDAQGQVRYARWDNTDPKRPWIGKSPVAPGKLTSYRPALGNLNRRVFSPMNHGSSGFGDDLFATMTEVNSKSVQFINFSRAIYLKDIASELAIYTSNIPSMARSQCDPNPPTRVTDLAADGRPFYSELGYLIWTLPYWLAERLISTWAQINCWESSGRFDPPCDQVKYPVIVSPSGEIFISGGIWQTERDDYKRIWEELGHAISAPMGLMDEDQKEKLKKNGTTPPPTQENANLTGIPLPALIEADKIFGENLGGSTSGTRRAGFVSGQGLDYDLSTRQHSFIYIMHEYFSNGDQLRAWVQEDIETGDTLLQRKYDWIKSYIFKGVEFSLDNAPLV